MKRLLSVATATCALACGARAPAPHVAPVNAETAITPLTVRPGYVCPPPPSIAVTPIAQSGISGNAEFLLSRDGTIAAARATSQEIQLWNVATGVKLASIGSQAPIDRFALRPDGRALATVTAGRVSIRDLERGVERAIDLGPGSVGSLGWTTDSRTLFVGRPEATMFIDASGALRSKMPTVALRGGESLDGRSLLASDGTMWDLATGQPRWQSPVTPSSVVYSDDGNTVAFAIGDKGIEVHDVITGSKRWDAATNGTRGELAISPDGQSVAAYEHGMQAGTKASPKAGAKRGSKPVDVRDVRAAPAGMALWHKGKRVRLWQANDAKPTRPTFSPDSTRIAIVSRHISEARLYDVEIHVALVADGSLVSLTSSRSPSLTMTGELREAPPWWGADGASIIQPGNGGLYVFNGERRAARIVGKAAAETSITGDRDVAFAPDDASLVLLAEQGDRQSFRSVARVWDMRTGTSRVAIDDVVGAASPMRAQRYNAVEYSPDGQLIALDRTDGVVLWDGRSNTIARILDADPKTGARRFAFAPDGHVLATTISPGREVRLWDPWTGARLRTLTFDDATVESFAFSADGSRLAIGTSSQSASTNARGGTQILLFDPSTGALVRSLHAPPRRSAGGYASAVTAIHWEPKGRAIVSVDSSGNVDLWNTSSDDPPQPLIERISSSEVGPSVLSADGNLLLTGGTTLGIWDLRTRALVREFPGDGSFIQRIRVNRAGTVVATVRGDHVDLYRIADGAHATIRNTGTPASRSDGLLTYADNGTFAGDAAGFGLLQVRASTTLLDVRPLRPEEVQALYRPSFAFDFMAGCPLAVSR